MLLDPVLDPTAAEALLRQAASSLEDIAERVPSGDDWHRRHAAWAADPAATDAVRKLQAGAALYASAPIPAETDLPDAAA